MKMGCGQEGSGDRGHADSRMSLGPVSDQACNLGNSPSTKQFQVSRNLLLGAPEHREGTVCSLWTWAKKERMNEGVNEYYSHHTLDLRHVSLLDSVPPGFHLIFNALSQILL